MVPSVKQEDYTKQNPSRHDRWYPSSSMKYELRDQLPSPYLLFGTRKDNKFVMCVITNSFFKDKCFMHANIVFIQNAFFCTFNRTNSVYRYNKN